MQIRVRVAVVSAVTAVVAASLLGPLSGPAQASPADGATSVTVPDLVGGDAVLRFRRSYAITSCSATSLPLSLFVQTSSGRWVKVATSASPERSESCRFSSSSWLQTYNWTVNQVGTPVASGGPNRLNLALGTETPRSKFAAEVWPSAPTFS